MEKKKRKKNNRNWKKYDEKGDDNTEVNNIININEYLNDKILIWLCKIII